MEPVKAEKYDLGFLAKVTVAAIAVNGVVPAWNWHHQLMEDAYVAGATNAAFEMHKKYGCQVPNTILDDTYQPPRESKKVS